MLKHKNRHKFSSEFKAQLDTEPLAPFLFETGRPAISMELSLGSLVPKGTVLDIDDTLLERTFEAVGMEPSDSTQLFIQFLSPTSKQIPRKTVGYYDPELKDVKVVIPSVDNMGIAKAQKTLQHEVKHAKDDAEGAFEKKLTFKDRLYDISASSDPIEKAGKLGILLGGTALATNTYTELFPYHMHDVVQNNAASLMALGFVAALSATILDKVGYVDNEFEVR